MGRGNRRGGTPNHCCPPAILLSEMNDTVGERERLRAVLENALPHSRMLPAPGEYRRAGIRQRRVSRWQRRVSCTLTASRGTLL